jgi:hypothetical protein
MAPGPLLEEQVTRFKVHRFAVLTIGAVSVLALSATTANAAPTAKTKAPAAVTSCQPASAMTANQRAALPNGVRVCSGKGRLGTGSIGAAPGRIQPATMGSKYGNININEPVADFNADYQFYSKYEAEITNAALRDVNCDGRSVFADVETANGFVAEYVNSLGCNHTQSGYQALYWFENSYPYMRYFYLYVYACNLTCSTKYRSSLYYNPYAT